MDLWRIPPSHSRTSLLIILITFHLGVNLCVTRNLGSPQQDDSYSYRFLVDEDGSAMVTINYTSTRRSGSSWVIVPKFLELTNRTRHGNIASSSFSPTKEKVDTEFYFYRVFDFSFESDGYFEMIVQFNFTSAAIVIEPDGIFFSPQIGFESGGVGKAEVILPLSFKADRAVSGYGRLPSFTNSNYVLFDNLDGRAVRLEVEFKAGSDQPDVSRIEDGVFTFETARRYENHAREILSLFNKTYKELVGFFNTTLEDVNVEFFIPDFDQLLSIGGYVPFTSEEVGNIHINIFYTRYVKGYVEVIALHELVHHFLWKAGLSPEKLLWFHEGMAQYVSNELAMNMGYEGASMMKQELEYGVSQLDIGSNLGFLQQWTPSSQPVDLGTLYVASYYVVTELARPYGGLEYYARFFDLLNGAYMEDSSELAYFLSLASNATVVPRLRGWGFRIVDLSSYSNLIMEAEASIRRVNPIYQPYRLIAEQLYKWALMNAEQGRADTANILLLAVVTIAELAPLLTLITVSGCLFAAILYALKRKGLFSDKPLQNLC